MLVSNPFPFCCFVVVVICMFVCCSARVKVQQATAESGCDRGRAISRLLRHWQRHAHGDGLQVMSARAATADVVRWFIRSVQ